MEKTSLPEQKVDLLSIPDYFPPIPFPSDNTFTEERWTLGKALFYDKALSRNETVSCGSCHKPHLAFSDDVAVSLGDLNTLGRSNAPSLTNIGYNPYFTRAGGVPTLEMQVNVPIQEHDEFNFNIVDIVERLKDNAYYQDASLKAYNRDLDPYVITRAIATFERSIISGNSPYDKFTYQNKPEALSTAEKKGMDLFFSSRTNCSECHSGFNFSTYAFENNGLHERYSDSGRMRITKAESDRDKFKVPTLRNVELTSPYMHDGSLKTLTEVVEHYNTGGVNHKNKSQFIKALQLTEEEKTNLVAFLKSLTDYEFANQSKYKPEQ
ncbi:MAG: cytochrome c peroxidase [Bacteroidia bacterium]